LGHQYNGCKAEEIVLEYERARLIEHGLQELAIRVEDCSQRYGLGYDVSSFNDDHSERHIEVKVSKTNHFIISRTEFEYSRIDDAYWIYLVSWNDEGAEIKMLKNP
jgi:hypothetical protein